MNHPTPSASPAAPADVPVALRLGGRAGLVVLAAASGVGLLGSFVTGAMATTFVDGDNLYAAAGVVTDREPATRLPGVDLGFDSVQLLAPAQADLQWLEGIGVGLPYAAFGATCLLLLVLVRRLWTARSFTRFAAWGLVAVGLLTLASGLLSRWLPQLATQAALERLGLPGSYEEGLATSGTGEWFSAAIPSAGLVDYPGIGLGVVLLLVAVLVHRGRTLQESADGLV